MENKLREYLDGLFEAAPATKKTVELKEEMLQNLLEKFRDLIAEGKSEDAAYNLAVASVGDVDELISYLKKQSPMQQYTSSGADEANRKLSALITAFAIALFVLSPVPLFLLQDVMGLVVMVVVVAIGVAMLVYRSMSQPQYEKLDDTLVEDFKEWKLQSSQQNSAFKSISAAVWSIALAVYFIISFLTMAWHVTWIIFLITSAVNAIIKAAFDLRK